MPDARGYWFARLLLQRGIALICLVAFTGALNQFRPLLGERGLLPVPEFIKAVPFRESPSLFYLFPRDAAFTSAAWIGIVLSCLALFGIPERYSTFLSMAVWASLWILYLSFVNVGQIFYGFGWESILLEACFFAIFLGGSKVMPQSIPLWLFRWLLFRIMFGAGLIKLRGDSCWKDLTCLNYYFETQPIPNPLSWYAHWAPVWFHQAGVLFNHFAELIVPFAYFLPQPFCGIAGLITIAFQASIILTGNLSWLNWLTLILAFSTLDSRFLPWAAPAVLQTPSRIFVSQGYILAALIALLSIPTVLNMISASQVMNMNFNSLHLAGTYGAFGSITRPRYEVVIQGTADSVITPATTWSEYEFRAKPGSLAHMPPQIAPYHLRIDWLMWFAALSDSSRNPWFVQLLVKLLQGDADTLSLLRLNPFAGRPPHFVRAQLYEYHFSTPDEKRRTGAWWTRRFNSVYFPAVSLNDVAAPVLNEPRLNR